MLLTVAIFALGYYLERKVRKAQNLMVWREFRYPIILFANEYRSLDCLVGAYYNTVAVDFKTSAHDLIPASLTAKSLLIQVKDIKKALEYLPAIPNFNGPMVNGKVVFGWSCKRAIVETKRQFLSEMLEVIDAKNWVINMSQSTPTRQKD